MRAFDVDQGVPAAALVLLLMNVATIMPLWPGNVGLVQVAVATPLKSSTASRTRAGSRSASGCRRSRPRSGSGSGSIFLAREGLSFAGLRQMPGAAAADDDDDAGRRRRRRRLSTSPRALACPASLKDVLRAPVAADALVRGFARAGVEADALPVADGGEGTAAVLCRDFEAVEVEDAFGRPRVARTGVMADGTRVFEAAEAIPLDPERLDVMSASRRGLGLWMSRYRDCPARSWPSAARPRWTPAPGSSGCSGSCRGRRACCAT